MANRLIKTKDAEGYETTYSYNVFGDKISTIDALLYETTYTYDNLGRLVKVTDAEDVSTSYGYDKIGNKTYMLDGRGKITKYTYGSFGKLLEVKDPQHNTITYEYDIAGNLALMKDKNGNHTFYLYNPQNQLIERTVLETGDTITYDYDPLGNKTQMEDESGLTTYRYNSFNKLEETIKDGEREITYSYDSLKNIEQITDKNNNITKYTYDESNRLETVTSRGTTTTYAYDANGNRDSITYEGGVKEAYTYDRNNKLLTLTNKNASGVVLSQYTYTYDAVGREKTKTDSFGTTTYTYDKVGRVEKVATPGKTTVYSYDNSGNRQSMIETYTSFQPSGFTNTLTKEEVTYIIKKSHYTYTPNNKLINLEEKMYNGQKEEVLVKTTTFRYDNNGNELRQTVSYIQPHTFGMKQETKGNIYGDQQQEATINNLIEKTSNTFDGFNRLKTVKKIKNGVQTITSFTYNGKDLRTKKEVKTSTDGYEPKITNYYYDRQHVILETDETGNTITSYIRGNNYIARVDNNEKISYYLYNGHGDVVQTVSQSGQIENQYDYDIFGNPILTIEQGYTNAIRYAGEFYDSETGLYYLRARYYNPYTGRFISEDSYWGEDTNPLSLNLYTYCHNDPINFIDPTGHWQQGDEKLTVEGQKKVKALTDAYWATQDEGERKKIHEEANQVRKDYSTNTDNGDSFAKEVNKALGKSKTGYMTADEWKETSKKNNRRSKGKRSARSKKEDFRGYADNILNEAEKYSDYVFGSDNYKEEITIINKTSGETKARNQIKRDFERELVVLINPNENITATASKSEPERIQLHGLDFGKEYQDYTDQINQLREDVEYLKNQLDSLEHEMKEFQEKDKGPTVMEAALMAAHVYTGEGNLEGGWSLERTIQVQENESLLIRIYERTRADGTKEYAVVNAGTNSVFVDLKDTREDWGENGAQPFGNSQDLEDSISQAIAFVDSYTESNITFIGHSKGGAEAMANAIATDRDAIVFNPAMLNPSAYDLDTSNYIGQITSYVVEGEALDSVYNNIYNVALVNALYKPAQSTYVNKIYLETQHSVTTPFKVINQINAVRNHLMDAVIKGVKEWQGK